jgi:uncharacterized protein YjcR
VARTHSRKDWAALKAAYRRGEGSIAELAPKYGIAKSTAEKRCAREKWQVDRQEVGRKAEETAKSRDVESLADMLASDRRRAELGMAVYDAIAEEMLANAKKRSAGTFERLMTGLAVAIRQRRLAAGIAPDQPVVANPGAGRQRIIVKGGAAVAPAAPALAVVPPRTGT